MNFKERIGLKNIDNKIDVSDNLIIKSDISLFVNNELINNIVKEAVEANKNIILFCGENVDRNAVCNSFKNYFFNNEQFDVIKNINEELQYSSSKRVLIPEPSVQDLILIFESAMTDFKLFLTSFCLKSFTNVVESLKTLILLNRPNITEKTVSHLIGMSDFIMFYVVSDSEGCFNITDCVDVVYKDNEIFEKLLYSENNTNNSSNVNDDLPYHENSTIDYEDENKIVEEEAEDIILANEDSISEEKEEDTDIKNQTNTTEHVILPAKLNKYKLLKAKLKAKKKAEE